MDPPHRCPMTPTMTYLSMHDTYVDLPTACIDDVPDSAYGGIDLYPDEFYQVHALSSRHPPPQRPGQPTRPPLRPQSQNPRPTNPIRRYDGRPYPKNVRHHRDSADS